MQPTKCHIKQNKGHLGLAKVRVFSVYNSRTVYNSLLTCKGSINWRTDLAWYCKKSFAQVVKQGVNRGNYKKVPPQEKFLHQKHRECR